MPRTPTAPAVLTAHALAILVTITRSPSARSHPSLTSSSARHCIETLQAAGLLNDAEGPTSAGRCLVAPIDSAAAHLHLATSSPASERQIWLAERDAVVATSRPDQRLEIILCARSGIWDDLVSWLYLGDRPEPSRRVRRRCDADRLLGAIRAMQQRNEPTFSRLLMDARHSGQRDDVELLEAMINSRARSWILRARHVGSSDLVEMAAIDAGIDGWWRAWRRAERPCSTLDLDPVDTHEIWCSLAETLNSHHHPESAQASATPVA